MYEYFIYISVSISIYHIPVLLRDFQNLKRNSEEYLAVAPGEDRAIWVTTWEEWDCKEVDVSINQESPCLNQVVANGGFGRAQELTRGSRVQEMS